MNTEVQTSRSNKLIIAVSIIVPVAVAALFGVKIEGYDFTFLPPIYASINGLTAFLLIAAVVSIKKGNRLLHERLMKACLVCSVLFLVMYIIYHMTSDSTSYGGDYRVPYFFILITHIVLSIAVIPLVLFTYVRALNGNFAKHRKLAKITFPIWLYVAVTGVVVYWMISPFYQ